MPSVCPYCHGSIKVELPVTVCPTCRMPHLVECWEENGGCTTYGCKSARIDGSNATSVSGCIPPTLPPAPGMLAQQLRRQKRMNVIEFCAGMFGNWGILSVLLLIAGFPRALFLMSIMWLLLTGFLCIVIRMMSDRPILVRGMVTSVVLVFLLLAVILVIGNF